MKLEVQSIRLTKQKILFFAIVVFAFVHLSKAENSNLNIFEDSDQDGLADQEEVVYGTDPHKADTDDDGYTDGEEIKSGYNPLKPAPGDKIIADQIPEKDSGEEKTSDSTNITDKFIENLKEEKGSEIDVLQRFSTDPSSFSDQTAIESLQQASLTSDEMTSILSGSVQGTDLDKELVLVSESELKILPKPTSKDVDKNKQEEKKQIEEYVAEMSYILSTNAPFDANEKNLSAQLVSFINGFGLEAVNGDSEKQKELKKTGEKIYSEMKNVEVPNVMKDVHITGISLIKYLLDENFAKISDQSDPLGMAMSLGKVNAVMTKFQELGQSTMIILDEYGINEFSALQSKTGSSKEEQKTEE